MAAEDGIVVMTRAPGGVVGVINHTWSVGQPTERPWVSISGTKGSLYFELGRPWLRLDRGSAQETWQLDDDPRGLAPMVHEFRQSVLDGREPAMTGPEGLEDLELVLKAYESMQTGRPVLLDGPEGRA